MDLSADFGLAGKTVLVTGAARGLGRELALAFAPGGAAVTCVEAISNGVPAFKEPAWKHARQTLVLMGCGLGVMFLGLSALPVAFFRHRCQPFIPYFNFTA